MTIPTPELQAAVYGAQIAQFLKEEQYIEYSDCVFWSDSTTVLYWLRTSEKRHRKFVLNRIAKILDVDAKIPKFSIGSTFHPQLTLQITELEDIALSKREQNFNGFQDRHFLVKKDLNGQNQKICMPNK